MNFLSAIPTALLRSLYTTGSLRCDAAGFRFCLKNRLSDATLVGVVEMRVDGRAIPLEDVELSLGPTAARRATDVSRAEPAAFPLRQSVELRAVGHALEAGSHDVELVFETAPFGRLELRTTDTVELVATPTPTDDTPAPLTRPQVPYEWDQARNYSPDAIAARQRFVGEYSGVPLRHLTRYSLDPLEARGNCENFTGVAQVPIGFAGPLRVNGDHAQGEFLVPLATTEGSLVASYNRGMKLLTLAGGVSCTVSDDCMQRAPVFIFDSAREARAFRAWIEERMAEIRTAAEATSRVARLLFIDTYLSNKFAFLRFNFSTGDAAGQNMVSKATYAACQWILARAPGVRRWYLEANLATDKKASHVNLLRTRGKRVTAEATIPRELLLKVMRVDPEALAYHWGVANVGGLLAGVNNNGLHAANGITAMFIATGQDVANVSEGSAGLVYSELTPERGLYVSITLPSLIVGTFGGGTGLATQRECLEVLGCYGAGKVRKLAEIVAGVVLAGEISLASAISANEWVSAHERYGRNR